MDNVPASVCWVTNYAGLYTVPTVTRLMYLNAGARVMPTGRMKQSSVNGAPRWFAEVEYTYKAGGKVQTVTGWIYVHYLEALRHEFPDGVIRADNATDDPNDAAQFNVYGGKVQHNLCGQFCVLYVSGWHEDINWFLDQWKEKAPNAWQRVFPSYQGRGTDIGDLNSMLSVFPEYRLPAVGYGTALTDPVKGAPLVTPGRIENLLEDNFVIASCRIDGNTGRLRGQGVGHWVVLEKVIPDGIGNGWVELYNPFPNRRKRYSWSEWLLSSGQPYGIVVPR